MIVRKDNTDRFEVLAGDLSTLADATPAPGFRREWIKLAATIVLSTVGVVAVCVLAILMDWV